MRPTIDGLARLALLLSLGVIVASGISCRGGDTGEQTTAGETTAGQPTAASTDGEGMEPRIVIEHPVDAPGRPEDGAAPALEPAPTADWVPHLAVTDLDASEAFYRDLGFTVGGRRSEDSATERIELARDDARLVLVARPPPSTDEDDTEDTTPEDADDAPIVLHLVAADATGARTVTDPDGHRLLLPEGR